MGIKLVVTDIDGTLIDSSEKIPPQLAATVKKCRENGIRFAVSTGRTKELAEPIIKELGITDPCVIANGACIVQENQYLAAHDFSVLPILRYIGQADRDGLTVTLTDEKGERAIRETDYVRYHQSIGNRFKEPIDLDGTDWYKARFQKVMFMDENKTGKIHNYQKEMENFKELYWVTTYSDAAVELGPKGCNKATGVKELAGLLGVSMDEIMACGDFSNDLEMIRVAGVGVAVNNAIDELKEAADYVAKGSFAYGVMEAIETYCF